MTRNELKRELHIETPPLTTTSSSATTELPLLYPLALRNIAHMHQDRIVPPPIHPSSGSTTTTEEKLHHQEEEMLRF